MASRKELTQNSMNALLGVRSVLRPRPWLTTRVLWDRMCKREGYMPLSRVQRALKQLLISGRVERRGGGKGRVVFWHWTEKP